MLKLNVWMKARVSWFLEWRIDRCNKKSSGGKIKIVTHFFFYFGLPTISQWLLAQQKWFTYQNVQNVPRKTVLLFLEQSVEKVILKINQEIYDVRHICKQMLTSASAAWTCITNNPHNLLICYDTVDKHEKLHCEISCESLTELQQPS